MLKQQNSIRDVFRILRLQLDACTILGIVDNEGFGKLPEQVLERGDSNLLYGIDGHTRIVSPLHLVEIVLVDI
jgi:hypothetical protein